ncbi:MAG: carbon starvation CstA family protein [Candidatus Gygaella obscura]|nr:carbon starvation CstA family protein [Candidatus Gygaella obscura]
MNSVVILLIGIAGLALGYFFYARLIEKLFGVDFNRQVPAVSKCDGQD